MNPKFATMILTASLLATLGVNSLNAQERATANVPFPFHVKSQTMPAGTYEVKTFPNGGGSLFVVTNNNGHAIFVNARVQGIANPNNPKLTFTCSQGDCSLTRIELPGSSVSHDLYPAKSPYNLGITAQVAVRTTR